MEAKHIEDKMKLVDAEQGRLWCEINKLRDNHLTHEREMLKINSNIETMMRNMDIYRQQMFEVLLKTQQQLDKHLRDSEDEKLSTANAIIRIGWQIVGASVVGIITLAYFVVKNYI